MKSYLSKSIGIALIAALGAVDLYLSLGQWNATAADPLTAEPSPTFTASPALPSPTPNPGIFTLADYTGPKSIIALDLIDAPPTEAGLTESVEPDVDYFEAGMVTSGTYSSKPLILATYNPSDPGGIVSMYFVEESKTSYIALQEVPEYYTFKYKSIVTKVDTTIKTHHPKTISLDDETILTRTTLPSDYMYSTRLEKPPYYEAKGAQFILSNRSKIGSYENLTFYGELKATTSYEVIEGEQDEYKKQREIREQYLKGLNTILAVDQSNVAFLYTLGTRTNEQAIKGKEEMYGSVPSYSILKSEVSGSTITLHNRYAGGFPASCTHRYDSPVLKGITAADLTQIGTITGEPLYVLTDKSHKLYSLAYPYGYPDQPETAYLSDGREVTRPTLEEYVATNPILIRKDFYGRYIALQEDLYTYSDGCGKPVVYLYPEVRTNVTVAFQAPVKFTTQIPTYNSGWFVEASPNGQLKDLQPQLTSCATLPVKPGSEFAKEACTRGVYPYLYWAGSVTSIEYPKATGGWVVPRADVEQALQAKLTEMGLNEKEKQDMMEYWVPALLAKQAPYYRISFFQTATVNAMFPMKVTPTPDTTFRIFLDWEPLTKPTTLAPQKLQTLTRKGFTLVEWGGLKR